jgi:GTP-binding protein Era
MELSSNHKAGFVNIIGSPNVGKSTIMNEMVGEKVSIITSKAQTTRHRIHGIVNGDDFQIIYSDTPGILDPKYKLQENMLNSARSALSDADIIIYVTEPGEKPGGQKEFSDKLKEIKIPVVIVLNKIDLSDQEKVEGIRAEWLEILPDAFFIPVSALEKFNLDTLFKFILEKLPVSPPYYSKEELTDKSERFFTGEIIREKILLNYRQEIPYAVEIEIADFKDEPRIIRISAVIYVERDSQKGIIIGNKGDSIKKIGTEARLDLEKFFNKKVFLELFVKVRKDWRNNERMLRNFGYRG